MYFYQNNKKNCSTRHNFFCIFFHTFISQACITYLKHIFKIKELTFIHLQEMLSTMKKYSFTAISQKWQIIEKKILRTKLHLCVNIFINVNKFIHRYCSLQEQSTKLSPLSSLHSPTPASCHTPRGISQLQLPLIQRKVLGTRFITPPNHNANYILDAQHINLRR